MAKDSKFGTFGGVFTPSLLTILGVIMYLRLPWVVGQAGLWSALGIIVVAHVISVSTGLSISSIATDKTVGAGGPYYIVSRSLGLSIGGTLGLALFVGLSFSVSLYIIGFSESFLSTIGRSGTPTEIRVVGSIVLILLSIVTLISTSFAIKTQYVILVLIALSLASIFAGGSPGAEGTPHLKPIEDSEPMGLLFGIFFPAVTGFTAGVNMSGDLRDPRRSIPRGTMAAIMLGMVVYVGLAVFVALRASPEQLVNNTQVLKDLALVPALVVAGIWGATLSSALGSIMGAPRILQALSVDRITPNVFAKGHGKTNEPRNALILAFFIAEGGILIAELDAIARIVSMVYLTTYGFLNTSSAIESWASPDFRPAFRIPRTISVLGAVTTVVVMIQLDLLAMLGASALMTGLFLYLKRKQLTLEGGDTWEGIWSSLVRSGLYRLSQVSEQRRNWRPNIVAFRSSSDEQLHGALGIRGDELTRFGETLVAGNGILTIFELTGASGKGAPVAGPIAPRAGVFARRLEAEDPYEAIALLSRYHGFAGLSPNTVLMQYGALSRERERLAALLEQLSALDKNLLLYTAGSRGDARQKRIDIWWRPDAGNLSLCVALARFLTSSERHRDSEVRFLLVSEDAASNDQLRTMTKRMLMDARLTASVRVLGDTGGALTFAERLHKESGNSELTLLGLPNDLRAASEGLLDSIEELRGAVGEVLFVWASSAFEEELGLSATQLISFRPPALDQAQGDQMPELQAPTAPALAHVVSDLADRYRQRVAHFHEQAVARVCGDHVRLVRDAARAVERRFDQFEKGFRHANPRQRPRLAARIQSMLLDDCRKLLVEFQETLQGSASRVQGQVEGFLGDDRLRGDLTGPELVVVRSAEDFKPAKGDSPYLRRFKRRRRFAALFRRADVSYRVPVQGLLRYYFERASLDIVRAGASQILLETQRCMIQCGRTLSSGGAAFSFDLQDEPERVLGAVSIQRQQLVERLNELAAQHKQRIGVLQWRLMMAAHEICQAFSDDVARLDVRPLVKKQRRASNLHEAVHHDVCEDLEHWVQHQKLLVDRALLGLSIAEFQFRLSTIAHKERAAIVLQLSHGSLAECEGLRQSLGQLQQALAADGTAGANAEVKLDSTQRFDEKSAIDSLLEEAAGTVAELPEVVNTPTDESIQKLEEGSDEGLEMLEIPVRRLFQFLVETRFVGGIQMGLKAVPRHEQRLLAVAHELERHVAFHLHESEATDVDGAEERQQTLAGVLDTGLPRLDAELDQLRQTITQVRDVFEEQLQLLAESGNAYELGATFQELEQHLRLGHGARAVHGAHSLLRVGARELKSFMVKLLYRRSAGQLLAKRRQRYEGLDAWTRERVQTFIEHHSPRAEVVESLPFYYKQLFYGQATIGDNFWVGRREQLARIGQSIQDHRQGAGGAILIVGDRGTGKTALCQRIAARLLDGFSVSRVIAPMGGSVEMGAFAAGLRKATGLRGGVSEVLRTLPENAAVILDDVELWWERSRDGDRIIEELLRGIQRHGEHVLFVLSVSRQALHLMDRFTGLSDLAQAVVECDPLTAEELEAVMLLRHSSTGLTYELDGTPEERLSQLGKARLFSRYFEYSGGVVGAALHAWLARVERVSEQVLITSAPRVRDWEVFEGLKVEWVALLLEFFVHKQLGMARLRRITELAPLELERSVEALLGMRIIHEPRQGVYEINPAISHVLSDRLKEKGLLL